MLTLKGYQERALETLHRYFQACARTGDADTAFYETTRERSGKGSPYRQVAELPGLPYVCLRMPTGGGKTLVACHAANLAAGELLRSDRPLVLWLVPSNPIREQTLKSLGDRRHPYRQALEAGGRAVSVLDIREALHVQPGELDGGMTVIVSSVQAFRVTDPEARKVHETSGSLMAHFSGLSPEAGRYLEKGEGGAPAPSLSNVLRLRRPIVVMDEAHNARTELSFETLARFSPSCILEFTATPDTEKTPSNVLHSVSAAELNAEAMIKLPIRLENRSDWREVLSDAVAMLDHLDVVARREMDLTGEYIRPVMLIQAEARRQGREGPTVDVVRQALVNDNRVSPDQIALQTGEDRGLEDVDLSNPDCPLRFVITVRALQEGWDCPFAYVLCSVAEMRSATAIEQILGRIMRLPNAAKKRNPELNRAYAFTASADFYEAAGVLKDGLIKNGFERRDVEEFIRPLPAKALSDPEGPADFMGTFFGIVPETPRFDRLPPALADRVAYNPASCTLSVQGVLEKEDALALEACFDAPEAKRAARRVAEKSAGRFGDPASPTRFRNGRFAVPVLAVRRDGRLEPFEDQFTEVSLALSECDASLSEAEFSLSRPESQIGEIAVNEQGLVTAKFMDNLRQDVWRFEREDRWTDATLVSWLDRSFEHRDIPHSESVPFIGRAIRSLLDGRRFSLSQLVHERFRLRDSLEIKVGGHRQAARKTSFWAFAQSDASKPLIVSPELEFVYDPAQYPCTERHPQGGGFKRHYYAEVGDLNDEEFECARFLDALPLRCWVRNLSDRSGHSFWLPTPSDKFYPDFVCLLEDGRVLAIEYKGAHLWDNPDSDEKRAVGKLWADRSVGRCLFVMPNGQDWGAISTAIGTRP